MITEEKFQEALKIVNEYVLQLNAEIERKENTIKKTKVEDFVLKHRDKIGSIKGVRRLLNSMSAYSEYFPFVEDILAKGKGNVYIRGFGKESWDVLQFLLSNQADA